jgi:hypothetical protein
MMIDDEPCGVGIVLDLYCTVLCCAWLFESLESMTRDTLASSAAGHIEQLLRF